MVAGKWYTLVLEYRRGNGGSTRARIYRGKPSDTGQTMPEFLCDLPPTIYDRHAGGAIPGRALDVGFGADTTEPASSWTQFADFYAGPLVAW